ncbi:unnamed protein product [Cunninghamella echinulata]
MEYICRQKSKSTIRITTAINTNKKKYNTDILLKPFKANVVTITQTHVFTSTIYPSRSLSSPLPSSITSSASFYLPPSMQTISSTIPLSSPSPSSSTNSNASDKWPSSFPVLLTFAVVGILCLLSLIIFLLYYLFKKYNIFLYLKQKIYQDNEDVDDEKTLRNEKIFHSSPYLPSTSSYIINDLNGREQHSWATTNFSQPTLSTKDINTSNSNINKKDDNELSYPSTFIPIDASSLTLVPRSLIWKDPNRRRGVDELDLWEKRQQQRQQRQQQPSSNGKQRQFFNLPRENNIYDVKVEIENENKQNDDSEDDDNDDGEEMDPSSNMDNDRPWQRYKLKSPIPQSYQLSDIVQNLTMQVYDQKHNHSNRSSNTILQSRPISTIQDNSHETFPLNNRSQIKTNETEQSNNKVSDVVLARRILKASALELSSSQSLSSTTSTNRS